MNNLYNATNKNSFYNKLTTASALLVPLIYLLSITLIPIVNSIINTKSNAYVNIAKQYSALLNKGLVAKINSAAFNTINTTTYINNGQMLARQIDDNNLQNYVNDAKDSALKLNSADKSQNQTYSYDAYNKPITNTIKSDSALNVVNSFQYNGERFDNNTALQYLRARFYNPETKRFLNQDSYDLLNRFGYVNGNPVMNSDPTGNNVFSDFADLYKQHLTSSIVTTIIIGVAFVAGIIGIRHARKNRSFAATDATTKPPSQLLSKEKEEWIQNWLDNLPAQSEPIAIKKREKSLSPSSAPPLVDPAYCLKRTQSAPTIYGTTPPPQNNSQCLQPCRESAITATCNRKISSICSFFTNLFNRFNRKCST